MNFESEIPGIITGAGGTAAIGWLWLKTTLKDKQDLVQKLEVSDSRERELTAKVIEALLLNTAFLESHQGNLSGFGVIIKEEVERLSASLQSLSNELLKGPDSDS